jgi:hypothetical protein
MTSEEKRFWKDVYLSALDTVQSPTSNWSTNGEKVSTIEGYSELAKKFADEAVRKLRAAYP